MGLKETVFDWSVRGKDVLVQATIDFRTFLVEAASEGARTALSAAVKSAINGAAGGVALWYVEDRFGGDNDGENGTNGANDNGGPETTTTPPEAVETTTVGTRMEETRGTVTTTADFEMTTTFQFPETVTPDGELLPLVLLDDQFFVGFLLVFVISFVFFGVRSQRR